MAGYCAIRDGFYVTLISVRSQPLDMDYHTVDGRYGLEAQEVC